MNTSEYLFYLLKCSVSGTKADTVPDDISLEKLFRLAKREQVENIAFAALPPTEREPDIMRKFSQCYEKAIVRESKQELTLKMLSDAFTDAGIKHIPLKGSVIKHLYPSPDLRQSGDIDILADTYDGVEEIMEEFGFEPDMNTDMHESYRKGKMHIEIHSSLTDQPSDFCKKVWNNAECSEGLCFRMSPEFLYVYLLVHLHTHLMCGGAGIKLILDLYIFNRKANADREKIKKFAEEAGVKNLLVYAEALAAYWFDNVPYSDENIFLLEKLILESPVYGSFENYIKMHYTSSSKAENIFRLIFPPYKRMVRIYPVLERFPFLLPVMWVKRIIRRLLAKDKHIQVISDNFSGTDKNEIKKYINFRNAISDK